jgi:hypothetical protein
MLLFCNCYYALKYRCPHIPLQTEKLSFIKHSTFLDYAHPSCAHTRVVSGPITSTGAMQIRVSHHHATDVERFRFLGKRSCRRQRAL